MSPSPDSSPVPEKFPKCSSYPTACGHQQYRFLPVAMFAE